MSGSGPTAVITDLCVLEPDPDSKELHLTQLHEGVTIEQVREATGWELRISDNPAITPTPSPEELTALRALVAQ